MEATIILLGPIPAKKNLNRSRVVYSAKAGKNIASSYRNREIQDQIESLVIQAKMQWAPREPAVHPEITVALTLPTFRADQDNCYTTILDVLQSAGVIKNDNPVWNNGWKHLAPVEKGEPGAVITLRWNRRIASSHTSRKSAP